MNCRVSADLPTPPLPTMMTLWSTRELWFLFLLDAMAPLIDRRLTCGVGSGELCALEMEPLFRVK